MNISFFKQWYRPAAAAIIVGALSALMAMLLKHATEHYELLFFAKSEHHVLYVVLLPISGLALIHILRRYAFRNRANKGITEVFDAMATNRKLQSYKIPSHFVNGFLTVISGGSTGIEISTVVAAGAVGSVAHTKDRSLFRYKNELMCAGIAAGVTALFCSPLAGMFFVYEVISRRFAASVIAMASIATLTAFVLISVSGEAPLFGMDITTWHVYALPYFALLGILAGLHSVYLTRCVLFLKKQFAGISRNGYRIGFAGLVVSCLILWFPQLYGDGYHAMENSLASANTTALTLSIGLALLGLIVLKPIITAVTLSGGGDGGVFAPSLFAGAFLGLATALLANTFFDADVIPLNFMIAGMAAVLSASIHAPLTALFVVCGIIGDYTLFVPVAVVCFTAKVTAKRLFPYTVYSYPVK